MTLVSELQTRLGDPDNERFGESQILEFLQAAQLYLVNALEDGLLGEIQTVKEDSLSSGEVDLSTFDPVIFRQSILLVEFGD